MTEKISPPQSAYGKPLRDRMMVIWDLDDEPKGEIVPCGFVIGYEKATRVRIVGDGWGLREWWTEPLEGELHADLKRPVYEPGSEGHFNTVVLSLFKTFPVSKLPRVSS